MWKNLHFNEFGVIDSNSSSFSQNGGREAQIIQNGVVDSCQSSVSGSNLGFMFFDPFADDGSFSCEKDSHF